MATKLFHLWGENASEAKPIEIPESVDFEELQHIVASHFAVVDPNGSNFYTL